MRLSYDHRIKEAVALSRDPKLFEKYGVNPSTAKNWIYKGTGTSVISVSDQDSVGLSIKLKQTQQENCELRALVELYEEVNQIETIDLEKRHIKDEAKRQKIVRAVQKSAKTIGVSRRRVGT